MTRAEVNTQFKKHGKTEDAIGELITLWKDRLWLGHWTIDVTFEWSGIKQRERSDGNSAIATCDVTWEYMQAHLRFDLPACSVLSPKKLSRVVLHELLHITVNEMRETGIKHEERVVTVLEDVISWAYRDKRKKP